MDVKIGLIDSPRELVITVEGEQEAQVNSLREALAGSNEVLELSDTQGRRYLVRLSRVAYVEVGASTPRTVGFAGA